MQSEKRSVHESILCKFLLSNFLAMKNWTTEIILYQCNSIIVAIILSQKVKVEKTWDCLVIDPNLEQQTVYITQCRCRRSEVHGIMHTNHHISSYYNTYLFSKGETTYTPLIKFNPPHEWELSLCMFQQFNKYQELNDRFFSIWKQCAALHASTKKNHPWICVPLKLMHVVEQFSPFLSFTQPCTYKTIWTQSASTSALNLRLKFWPQECTFFFLNREM